MMVTKRKSAAQTAQSYEESGETFAAYEGKPAHNIEMRTVMTLMGDLRGKSVLDMGCGCGVFADEALKRGAAHVAAVDFSDKMLDLTREKIARSQGGALDAGGKAAFIKENISKLGVLGQFDVALAAFSFIYAESRAEFEDMFAAAARNLKRGGLKRGGRLVIYTINPDYRLEKGDWSRYSPHILEQRPAEDGNFICRVQFDEAGARSFTFCQWSRAAYETALKKAGFSEFFWREPMLIDADIYHYPQGFWDEYRANCAQRALVCARP